MIEIAGEKCVEVTKTGLYLRFVLGIVGLEFEQFWTKYIRVVIVRVLKCWTTILINSHLLDHLCFSECIEPLKSKGE